MEQFSSRLGFILISAGCAIGLGNVWRFPFITGRYGGATFVLIYLAFLVLLGLPVMMAEFAVGRASGRSVMGSFNELEPEGTKWHWFRHIALAGKFLVMLVYTTVAGWIASYLYMTLVVGFVKIWGISWLITGFGELISNTRRGGQTDRGANTYYSGAHTGGQSRGYTPGANNNGAYFSQNQQYTSRNG